MSKQITQYVAQVNAQESQIICANRVISFIRIYAIPGSIFHITGTRSYRYNMLMNNSGLFEMQIPEDITIATIEYRSGPSDQQIIVDCVEETAEQLIGEEVVAW